MIYDNFNNMNINTNNIDEQWEVLKQCFLDACREVLRVSEKKKEWWMNYNSEHDEATKTV